jgi:diguanylate cyclase (GGDEF)-like protein
VSEPPEIPQESPTRRRDPRAILARIAGALTVLFAAAWILWHAFADQQASITDRLLLPIAIFAAATIISLRQYLHWSRPRRALLRMLPRIRANELAIESLSTIKGGLEPLIPHLQELLRELREQKLAVSELHEDVRRRVASRTDALERLVGSLRQQAARDALTGLYNRRMFDHFLPQVVQRCREAEEDLAILMIDIDYFKALNDTLGHPAGDALLRDIGKLIRSGVRDQDAAFRFGGDEFVVLVPGATEPMVAGLVRRLTMLVDALVRPLRSRTTLTNLPHLSIGVALLSESSSPDDPQALLQEADQKLYSVKRARASSVARAG